MGEYAVLEGAPALVCAVDRYAEATLKESPDADFRIAAPSLGIPVTAFTVSNIGLVRFLEANKETQRKLGFFKVIFEFLVHYFRNCNVEVKPVSISLDTGSFYSQELNTKLGFGSSAAMTVALTDILLQAFTDEDNEQRRARIFRLALSAHRRAQGNLGSGVDVAASAFGGVLIYELGFNHLAEQKLPESLAIWHSLPMIAVWTGKSESTRKMVRGVGQLKKSHPDLYGRVLHELSELSKEGCRSYKEHDLESFLGTSSDYLSALKTLGDKSGMPIVSPVHLELVELVSKMGGVYKPSGAGSGDVGIAFARNQEDLEKVRIRIRDAGYSTLPVGIAPGKIRSAGKALETVNSRTT